MDERETLTRNQRLVLDKLEHAGGPLSAYTLLDGLREEGFRAPLQVYRALDRLMKAGLVHRLESLNSFVACSEHHHHADGKTAFAICETCGQVTELADPAIGRQLDAWVADIGFKASRAVLEFRGICRNCSAPG